MHLRNFKRCVLLWSTFRKVVSWPNVANSFFCFAVKKGIKAGCAYERPYIPYTMCECGAKSRSRYLISWPPKNVWRNKRRRWILHGQRIFCPMIVYGINNMLLLDRFIAVRLIWLWLYFIVFDAYVEFACIFSGLCLPAIRPSILLANAACIRF